MTGPAVAPDDADVTADVERSLAAIERFDGLIGAFVDVLADAAQRDATAAAAELSAGSRRSPLHGVPVAVKELFDVEAAEGSYGSLVLAGRRAEQDAAVVAALRNAGAVVRRMQPVRPSLEELFMDALQSAGPTGAGVGARLNGRRTCGTGYQPVCVSLDTGW